MKYAPAPRIKSRTMAPPMPMITIRAAMMNDKGLFFTAFSFYSLERVNDGFVPKNVPTWEHGAKTSEKEPRVT